MNSELKIPTFLGLAVLILGLTIGVYLTTSKQTFQTQASATQTPKNLNLANISAIGASVYWQTDEPISGFVKAGVSPINLDLTFSDDRDKTAGLQNHTLHFVSLTNLKPDTTYHLKINSGVSIYPLNGTLDFKTASIPSSPSQIEPLIGTVLNSQLQPSEALVVLEIPGVQRLASITKTAGNFVLSLSDLYNQDLSKKVDLTEVSLNSKLRVFDNNTKSELSLILPLQNSILEPIILGQDRGLTVSSTPAPTPPPLFDLNNDGYVNSLDVAEIAEAIRKKSKDPKFDLNLDKVVDEKDRILITSFVSKVSPTPGK